MAGLIKRESVDAVRDQTRIDEVIGTQVALANAGGGALKGLCPFHDEKTPSFYVRPSIGRYHCFGCGESGDAISFVEHTQALGFTDAVEYLANLAGVPLEYEDRPLGTADRQRVAPELRPRILAANLAAAEYFRAQIITKEAAPARKFLRERAFSREAADFFEVGFAPTGWDNLSRHLAGLGFTNHEIVEAGLAKPRNNGNGIYDLFRSRLMFPIRDVSGAILGFGGRRLDELEDDPSQVAKYLNTPETLVYKKSKVLFGIDKAKNAIRSSKRVVIVEGYTDVMAAWLSGVECAVATCGTAFGSEHAKLVRRIMGDHVTGGGLKLAEGSSLGGEVIFTFDGDKAGQEAAIKAFGEDQRFHAQTFVAVEPNGMDPCELRIAKGPSAVQDLVNNREPLFKFVIRAKLRQFDLENIEGRVEALRATAPIVAQIRDVAYREYYCKELARLIGTDLESVKKAVAQVSRNSGKGNFPATNAQPRVSARPPLGYDVMQAENPTIKVERDAITALLQAPQLVEPVFDDLPNDTFTHPALAWMHAIIQQAGGQANAAELGPKLWIQQVEDRANPAIRPLLNLLAITALPVADESKQSNYISEVIANLQVQHLDRQITEAKGRLSRAEANGSGYTDATIEIQQLEAARRSLLGG
jgi:DNA primase